MQVTSIPTVRHNHINILDVSSKEKLTRCAGYNIHDKINMQVTSIPTVRHNHINILDVSSKEKLTRCAGYKINQQENQLLHPVL